jgi:hypothetical protein
MKYLLVWSFTLNSSWITGTASFKTLQECLELKSAILEYKEVNELAYVECKLIESDIPTSSLSAYIVRQDMDRQITKGIR